MHQRTTRSATAAALFALALSACGGSGEQEDNPAEEVAADATAADGFEITDPWIKAVTQDEGMTGVFGEITNSSQSELTVVAAEADGADMVQLHEGTLEGADASMSEMEGGFVVPAGGSYPLEPGGDHIMLMELTRDLAAGDELTVTVEFEDGSTTTFDAAIRPYTGANEDYGDMEGDGTGDMEDMDEGHGDGSGTGEDGGGSDDGYGDE
ncbi:copper chaperone PCu(A)C [Nocardiopsis lucentensis]|uniref:copper chaperone PCu(A)C n=1 Tax=Nocardiopsis lucentensis TaxID=53441 RepID=UPI000349A4E7|nr:copper chaperone PCu(A)C [Nocardiopsis lucentensis]